MSKWLILGGGAVVTEYYLPAFQYLNLLDQLVIVEPSKPSVDKIKTLYPSIKIEQVSFQEYFKSSQIQVRYCIITLPNRFHTEAIKYCLDFSINYLCEKPLSLDHAEVEQVCNLSAESKLTCGVAMVRRLLPSYLALKKAFQNDVLGELLSVEIADGAPFAWVADSAAFFDKRNGGVLADMGIHYLDLLLDLLGPDVVPVAYLNDAMGGVEANCKIHLKHKETINVLLSLSRTRYLRNEFEVVGTKGRLYIKKNDFEFAYFEDNSGLKHVLSVDSPFIDNRLPKTFGACFVQQLMLFDKAVKDHHPYFVTPESALAPTKIIEWAYGQHLTIAPNALNSSSNSFWVSGGTGFIGVHLVNRLVEESDSYITAPVRSYRTFSELGCLGINAPRLDLLDYEAVFKSIQGHKYIFHMAYAADGKQTYDINVRATQNVVKAAYQSGAEAIVILSTMYVYGHPVGEELVDESWPYKPAGGEYGRTKKIMQEWCLDWAKKNTGTRLVLINPSCVYGPGGKTYTHLPWHLAKHNSFAWVDQGLGIANYVYVENLLDAMMLALKSEIASGQNFIISDGYCTWKEFLTPFVQSQISEIPSYSGIELHHLNQKPKSSSRDLLAYLVSQPDFNRLIDQHPSLGFIKKYFYAILLKFKKRLTKDQKSSNPIGPVELNVESIPPDWLVELFGNTTTKFSSKKAEEVLLWRPNVALHEGVEKSVSWLEEQYKFE